MPIFDFQNMTTDDLLEIIPENENREWEYKEARIFDKGNFGSFKSQKLGKIVSSFANSGGGYLLLGKRDKENVFEPVPNQEGRTAMEDHLSMVISQSVTPHLRDFEIYRLPITGTNGSVLLVKFDDSPVAPHQSVSDTNYYYRLSGHSVPAPHFHLELLRNRFTKSVIEIEDIYIEWEDAKMYPNGKVKLDLLLVMTVKNTSSQSATDWGVHVKSNRTDHRWDAVLSSTMSLTDGACIRGQNQVLLPSERAKIITKISGMDRTASLRPVIKFYDLASDFDICLRPVSQNYIGKEEHYKIDDSDIRKLRNLVENPIV